MPAAGRHFFATEENKEHKRGRAKNNAATGLCRLFLLIAITIIYTYRFPFRADLP